VRIFVVAEVSPPAAWEDAVKRLDLSFPEFGFIVATRAALGAGIGLLAAEKLPPRNRHRLGAALLAIGVLTTIPAAFLLLRQLGPTSGRDGVA
jgi:hypothetical protein